MSPVAYLYSVNADGTPGERWTLSDEPLVVGRGETAGASINDPSLSRGHFLIVREANAFVLVDLDSQNGTWVGNKKMRGCKLASGQIIRAGRSLFYFSDSDFGLVPPKIELPVVPTASKTPAAARAA